jgi:hypothetical protein
VNALQTVEATRLEPSLYGRQAQIQEFEHCGRGGARVCQVEHHERHADRTVDYCEYLAEFRFASDVSIALGNKIKFVKANAKRKKTGFRELYL